MEQVRILSIDVDKILIAEDRDRDLGDLEELKFSLDQYSMIHPIVVNEREDGRYDLIAGCRRLTAWKQLGFSQVTASLRNNLDEQTRLEIELEENIQRKDIEWFEEVVLREKIHLLKQERYSGNLPSRYGRGTKWALKDTARSIRCSQATLCEDIKLAQGLDKFPELRNSKNKNDAKKVLRRLQQGGGGQLEGVRVVKIKESLRNLSFEKAMENLEDTSVDLLILDVEELIREDVCLEIKRVLAVTGSALLFFPLQKMESIFYVLEEAALKFCRQPFIWHIRSEDNYQSYLWVSAHLVEPPSALTFFTSHKRDKQNIHQRGKPKAFYDKIVEAMTQKSAFVVNPSAHSPACAAACVDLGRLCQVSIENKFVYEQSVLAVTEQKY